MALPSCSRSGRFVTPLYGYYLQLNRLVAFQRMDTGPAAAAMVVANVVSAGPMAVFVFIGLPVLVAFVGPAALAALD